MTKSEAIEQILKDNDDYVKVLHQGEVIMEQMKRPTRTILQDTDERPNIFAPTYDAGPREFNPEKLVKDISADFWTPQDQVKDPSDEFLLNIKNLAIRHQIWEVPFGHLKVHGITFFTEYRPAQSIHEAIDKCITTYLPEYQAFTCDDWITFILPEDKIQSLLVAMDFAGDKLEPVTADTPELTQHHPTLDRN